MILFRPSLSKEVLNVTADKNVRFLIVNTIVDEDELCLVNIYAPNDQNQQINFYQKITDSIGVNAKPTISLSVETLTARCQLRINSEAKTFN